MAGQPSVHFGSSSPKRVSSLPALHLALLSSAVPSPGLAARAHRLERGQRWLRVGCPEARRREPSLVLHLEGAHSDWSNAQALLRGSGSAKLRVQAAVGMVRWVLAQLAACALPL